ncbi:uncharacterized protein LOC128390823 [Panonychus citri]|uniref:uncharacterized protein LOC128390823 n=1 Tax=Panonychus citri TaxID=50023 RepID=UPI002306F133|nr:uncharacterized protein LOC128390823 [Panonychus citri]
MSDSCQVSSCPGIDDEQQKYIESFAALVVESPPVDLKKEFSSSPMREPELDETVIFFFVSEDTSTDADRITELVRMENRCSMGIVEVKVFKENLMKRIDILMEKYWRNHFAKTNNLMIRYQGKSFAAMDKIGNYVREDIFSRVPNLRECTLRVIRNKGLDHMLYMWQKKLIWEDDYETDHLQIGSEKFYRRSISFDPDY